MKILWRVLLFLLLCATAAQSQTISGWFITKENPSTLITKMPRKPTPFNTIEQCEKARKALSDTGTSKCVHLNGYYIQPRDMAVFRPCLQAASAFPAMSVRPCLNAATLLLSENNAKIPGNHNQQVNFRAFEAAKCFHFAALGEVQLNDAKNATFLFSASQSILNTIVTNNVYGPLTTAAKRELKFIDKQVDAAHLQHFHATTRT
jgi:hypothetical protein